MNKKFSKSSRQSTTSNLDESDLKIKEIMINEKNLDEKTLAKNIDGIISVRFFSAILAGIIAGIFALTGIYGISLYFLNYLFTSIFIFIHVQRQRGNFFESVLSLLLQGLFNHLMVFTIFWVMFYNLVHIYV